MPFDVAQSVNRLSDRLITSEFLRKTSTNPFYTSLLIAFVVILVILFVFRNANTPESLLKMSMRAGFWVMVGVTIIMVLHNKILLAENLQRSNETTYGGVFNDKIFSTDEFIPVVPKKLDDFSFI